MFLVALSEYDQVLVESDNEVHTVSSAVNAVLLLPTTTAVTGLGFLAAFGYLSF